MANLTTEMMTIVSANTKPYVSAMNRGATSTRSFSRVVSRQLSVVTASIGGLISAAAAMRITMRSLDLAAKFEQQQVAFEVLLGSAEDAKRLMSEIQSFAASTPFQQDELQSAAKSLVAFGVESRNIVPTMQTLGNLSSGLGINIGELAEIYGKAKVQGRLFMEDINQLTGRGIPVIGELAKQFGVAESEVRDLVSKGSVGFEHLEKAFVSLTSEGGKFDGMIQRQSETFNGLTSTLKDNVDVTLRQIGETIMKELNLKVVLKDSIVWVQKFTPGVVEAFKQVIAKGKDIAGTFYNIFMMFKGVEKVIVASMWRLATEFSDIVRTINATVIKMMKTTATALKATGSVGLAAGIEAAIAPIDKIMQEHDARLEGWRMKSTIMGQQGIFSIKHASKQGYKKDLLNYFSSEGDSSSSGMKVNAPVAGRAPSPTARKPDFSSLLGFGRGLGGVGQAIGSRFMSDLMAMSGASMGPNNAILKGSSQSVSLEAERNRAQLDVGKSQLTELKEIKTGIMRLVDFGSGEMAKAADAFGGLF